MRRLSLTLLLLLASLRAGHLLNQGLAQGGPSATATAEAARLRKQGTDLLRQRDYSAALQVLTRALQLNPKDDLAYNERAAVYTYLDRDTEAIADFTRAIALNGRLSQAFRGRASACLRQGKHSEALADFNRAIELAPGYIQAYRGRSAVWRKLGKPREARADEEKANQLASQKPARKITVGKPPPELRLHAFYGKCADGEGLPIVSSAKVPDEALVAAAELVDNMLARRSDLREALIAGRVRIAVMAQTEVPTDVPEFRKLGRKDFWEHRTRGLGGTPANPTTLCAEENLLGSADDRYSGYNILIHELGHTIHLVGKRALESGFDGRLARCYREALQRGLWKDTYAATNEKEYWAEGVTSYFDANSLGRVRTREQLQKYDPDLAELIDEVFARNPWRWVPNGAHARHWE